MAWLQNELLDTVIQEGSTFPTMTYNNISIGQIMFLWLSAQLHFN